MKPLILIALVLALPATATASNETNRPQPFITARASKRCFHCAHRHHAHYHPRAHKADTEGPVSFICPDELEGEAPCVVVGLSPTLQAELAGIEGSAA